MKYIKLKYVMVILFAFFFAMIAWKFFSFLSFSDSSFDFEGDSKQEKLYPNAQIIQKITATKNNLNQINISISKFSSDFGEKIILEPFPVFIPGILFLK